MAAHGVPLTTVAALLILPLIATLVVLARQLIGLKGFNIFTPLLTAFVFKEMGLEYGLAIFILIALVSALVRFALRGLRLQYFPRMALVITSVTITIFLVFFLTLFVKTINLAGVSLLPILVLIAFAEQFVAAHIEHGAKIALTLTTETLLTAIAGYGLLTWPGLTALVLAFPVYFIFGVIALNALLGRWTGLRLLEIWRFRELLKIKRP